ncbi:MAG: NTP transferase domain-containing protein [Chloroflexi bacterium]|nr:NTP transferase domain-containing protein [Chloroflexota bacterium]
MNKVENEARLAAAREIARLTLREPRIERVVLGAMQKNEAVREVWGRITAVVLAAGESKRMGQTKQLLPWGDTTVLGHVLQNLKGSTVYDILVVSGHEAEGVEACGAGRGCGCDTQPALCCWRNDLVAANGRSPSPRQHRSHPRHAG